VTALLVVLAGGLGAASRYVVERAVSRRTGERRPWGTFAVNVSGCLLLGLLVSLTERLGAPDDVLTVLGVGLLGAYTTFSAYAVEVVKVDADGARGAAAAYALGSLLCGVLGAGLGLGLGRLG
jgi:CrcB protein